MGVQQMLLGGRGVVVVTAPDASGTVFLSEPAPANSAVSAGSTAVASGGTGSYTYSWTFLSGDAMSTPAGTTSAACTWSSTVAKNTSKSSNWRITVSDGATSASDDITVYLAYETDL